MKNIIVIFTIALVTVSCSGKSEKTEEPKPKLNISLAQWSLHQNLFDSIIDHLDFARISRDSFKINQLEYVSAFFQDKAEDSLYLTQMIDSCEKYKVGSLLIMVDNEGNLGDTSETARLQSVENHKKWIRAANFLGCYAIRVNGNGLGSADSVKTALVASLIQLADYAKGYNIAVIVENHGMPKPGIPWDTDTYSAQADWLADVMKKVDRENCGVLPDFGNFHTHDPYIGVQTLLPYAKGISAKTIEFDGAGEETTIDYQKMFQIINNSNFGGYLGIEYEGSPDSKISEYEGVRKTQELLYKYCTIQY